MEVTQHGETKATRIITFPKRRGHSMQGHEGEAQSLVKSQKEQGESKA